MSYGSESLSGRSRESLRQKLATFLGKTLFGIGSGDASVPEHTGLHEPLNNTKESLEQFLRELGVLGTGGDPESRHMAIAINALPYLQARDDLTIFRVDPMDQAKARQYHATVIKSLNPVHSHIPYSDPKIDESYKGYYLGIHCDDKTGYSTPVCTMEVADYAKQEKLAIINNVTADPGWRGRGLAAVMVTTVLRENYSSFPAAFLSSTAEGESFYQRLGFVQVGTEPVPR